MASVFPFARISRVGHHFHRLERTLLRTMIRDRILSKIQGKILGRNDAAIRALANREMPEESVYGKNEPRTNVTISISSHSRIQKAAYECGLNMPRFIELATDYVIQKGIMHDAQESPLESVRLLKSSGFGEEWKELERVLLFDADRLRHDSLSLNAVESPAASILPQVNGYSQFGSHNAGK